MQPPDVTTEWFTIAEAAQLLKVSTATLHRWLKDGRLRAYHVGPRAVRVHRADIAQLLVPTRASEEPVRPEAPILHTDLTVPPLTEAEAEAALAALKEAQAVTAAIAHHHGAPLSPSWPLMREAHEERAERL